MSKTYKNPPLIELIAEVRWTAPQLQLGNVNFIDGHIPGSDHNFGAGQPEELYMHFGAIAVQHGYSNFERLVPPGFPVQAHQAVYRYKNPSESAEPIVYQLGSGVFTVNATQPYRSWATFAPSLVRGLEMLRKAYAGLGQPQPAFSAGLVRYIDAFREEMTQGAPPLEFIGNTLGLKIQMPASVSKSCTSFGGILPTVQLQVPVKPGVLAINLGSGHVQGEPAILLDMTVRVNDQLSSEPAEAVAALSEARLIIHDIFVEMTGKLDAIMQPESDGDTK